MLYLEVVYFKMKHEQLEVLFCKQLYDLYLPNIRNLYGIGKITNI